MRIVEWRSMREVLFIGRGILEKTCKAKSTWKT
jgi:hypothetical protein